MTLLYTHPDGCSLEYDAGAFKLRISTDEFTFDIPIGPLGLIETGEAMIALGTSQLDEVQPCD